MRTQVRRQELRQTVRQQTAAHPQCLSEAGWRLLETYSDLAKRGEHLFTQLLKGQAPRQWTHYPEDDAIDRASGYQWFYHSHSPQDRPETGEHGHIHVFARRPLWSRRLQSSAEKAFAELCCQPQASPNTRHLLAIGFDAKGVPSSLFTVNSWVTGDLMLNAKLSMELLTSMRLNTGHPSVDTVIESVIQLCQPEIRQVLNERDRALRSYSGPDKLDAPELELLAQTPIDLDAKLR